MDAKKTARQTRETAKKLLAAVDRALLASEELRLAREALQRLTVSADEEKEASHAS